LELFVARDLLML
jgi:hypothetical protein